MNKTSYCFLYLVVVMAFYGCSFNSYQSALTQIDTPVYRKPDSLTIVSEDFSIGSIPWKDYYKDKHLVALIDSVLSRNLSFYSAVLQIEKANSFVQKANREFAPSLGLEINQSQIKRSRPDDAYNQHGIGLTLTNWEIDIWGKLTSNKRAALANALRKEANAQAVKVKLIADVATLYYRLIGLDAKLSAVNEIIATNKEYLAEQEQRIEQYENEATGNQWSSSAETVINKSHVAVEQAKAELYRAKSIKPDIQAQIFITENAINLLLSRAGGSIHRTGIEEVLSLETLSDTIYVGVPAELLHFRPDVMEAEYAVREAFHLKDAARSAFYPSLTLNARLGTEEDDYAHWSNFKGTIVYNLFAGITQPLFNKGKLKHNKKIRDIESKQKLAEYRQTVLKACTEVSNILVFYQMNYTQMTNKAKRYQALRKAFEYSRLLYKENSATYLDVFAAQSQLLQTRLEMSDAFVNYYTRQIELYKALGGGG